MRKPDFVVGPGDNPYMLRWWVIPRNMKFNIYLHKFMRSDEDEALHDHPWWNISIVLRKGYWEHRPMRQKMYREYPLLRKLYDVEQLWRGPGSIVFRKATDAHRLEVDGPGTWSLFITGPVIRDWGFLCPRGWRFWKDFVEIRDGGNSRGRGCGEI